MAELFSNLGIDGKLLFAQVVNFLLVLWLLNKFVFRKVIAHLEERKNRIEQGVELTEKAKREMERIGEARHRELEKARKEGESILGESRTAASKRQKELMAQVRAEAEKMLLQAGSDAEKKKEDAVKGARDEISKIALLMAERVLSRSLGKEDQEQAVKEVLQYLENQYQPSK